jgi:hypothetical protein
MENPMKIIHIKDHPEAMVDVAAHTFVGLISLRPLDEPWSSYMVDVPFKGDGHQSMFI